MQTKQLRFKVFTRSYGHNDTHIGRALEKEVNDFLSSHEVDEVAHEVTQEPLASWMIRGVLTNESYIIRYYMKEVLCGEGESK